MPTTTRMQQILKTFLTRENPVIYTFLLNSGGTPSGMLATRRIACSHWLKSDSPRGGDVGRILGRVPLLKL